MLKRLDRAEKELEGAIAELRPRERLKQVGLGGRLPGEVDIKSYPRCSRIGRAADAVVRTHLLPLVYAISMVGQPTAVTEASWGEAS